LSFDQLRETCIPIPPPAEQALICEILSSKDAEVESLQSILKNAVVQSTGLRQATLKAAFSGHLVEQNPADEPVNNKLKQVLWALGRATEDMLGANVLWTGSVYLECVQVAEGDVPIDFITNMDEIKVIFETVANKDVNNRRLMRSLLVNLVRAVIESPVDIESKRELVAFYKKRIAEKRNILS
jgi:hypothetical protein